MILPYLDKSINTICFVFVYLDSEIISSRVEDPYNIDEINKKV